ncbi:unnamed protein product [Linum tenue]|uniref:Pentatricopeptide repeat-containing protein n=1 Tax=Linum tenue TaxID=586396 RepID=A0AAV0GZH1_9ROSI|nr:unnamed protein product [Linum tenue]
MVKLPSGKSIPIVLRRRFSTVPPADYAGNRINLIPIPHRSIPEARGQDLDFVNVAHSHIIHSDWGKLELSPPAHFTPFRITHVLLKIQRDHVLSLEFFNWVKTHSPDSLTVETHSIILHILTKNRKFKSAESILKDGLGIRSSAHSGYCRKGLLSSAMKLRTSMGKNGMEPNVVTFNTLINGFAKEGKLQEASRVFSEMKLSNVVPNIVTFNTLINGFSQLGNSEMNDMLYQEMVRAGIKPDILTYNAMISGLCREGKTKKAAYLVKELDKERLVPNSSTFSALITGQCARDNPDRAFQLYRSMVRSGCHPNQQTFDTLIAGFCKIKDFDGAGKVLLEMFDRCLTPTLDIVMDIYNGLQQCGMDRLAMKLWNEMEARKCRDKIERVT